MNANPKLIVAALVATAIILGVILTLFRVAVLARRAKMNAGSSGIIGMTGRAETAIAPQGTIFVRGELWSASSPMRIAPGERVRVTAVSGLTLDVEVDKDPAIIPKEG